MIGGDARLQHGKHEDLAVTIDLEDGAAAIADVKISDRVEGHSRRDAHAFGVGGHGTVLCHAVHRSVITRRNIETARAVEGHAGGIHHFVDEGLDVVIIVDAVDRNRGLLPARSGKRDINVSILINRWVRYRVEILRDGNADPHLAWIALVTIGCDHDFTGSGAFGHAGHNELFRTDDDGTIYVAESHLRPAQFPGPEPTAANANLASRQSAPGIDGIDMGFAVYVFCARSSFHHLSISFLTHAVACLALSVSLQSEAAAAGQSVRRCLRQGRPPQFQFLPAVAPGHALAEV